MLENPAEDVSFKGEIFAKCAEMDKLLKTIVISIWPLNFNFIIILFVTDFRSGELE